MFLRRFSSNRKVENDTTQRHPLPDIKSSEVATPMYIYYRTYAGDGAIPSKTPAAPDDPFLGRIKALSVPPPYHDTAGAVKRTIAKMERINDRASTSLFISPYSKLPMRDADKLTILNRAGPGSTPQEPLAFVAEILDSERRILESEGTSIPDSTRRALESGGMDRPENSAEPDSKTSSEIQYLYYRLYVDDCEKPSKVAVDQEEPSLGRIQAASIVPPHNAATIKRCISRVEGIPELSYANLFANISCNAPLKEGHISILRTDCPGLSPKEPMAIVLDPSLLRDGRYFIKNRVADIYWNAWSNPIKTVHFWHTSTIIKNVTFKDPIQWDITHDTNGNIFITSPYAPSSWVGAGIAGSTVPVPWRLIREDSKFYYLTTDTNPFSRRNLRVPTTQGGNGPGVMAFMTKGDPRQMWEFIPVV